MNKKTAEGHLRMLGYTSTHTCANQMSCGFINRQKESTIYYSKKTKLWSALYPATIKTRQLVDLLNE